MTDADGSHRSDHDLPEALVDAICRILLAPAGDGDAPLRALIAAHPAQAAAIERMGVTHVACPVDETHYDAANGIVTTPAYMSAASIGEAARSIDALVDAVLQRVPWRRSAPRSAGRGDLRGSQPRSSTSR